MGTWGKMLGRLSAKSMESESKNILRTASANKIPGSLSLALDGTLKKGHDMKVFGLGTVAALANRDRYARFTSSMLAVYGAMESELDKASTPAVSKVWNCHRDILRRAPSLEADLADVSSSRTLSGATEQYVAGIRAAGEHDRASGGARLLGHLYCRYFADLFGGQMLGYPTQLALRLPEETPRHYVFKLPATRREYIEDVYCSLNDAGGHLTPQAFQEVADEALLAFKLNKDVYGEEPLVFAAAHGALNVCTGFVSSWGK